MKLANHILRVAGFGCADLGVSTRGIGPTLDKKDRELVPLLLEDLYSIRENEELLERGEIGKHRTMKKTPQ